MGKSNSAKHEEYAKYYELFSKLIKEIIFDNMFTLHAYAIEDEFYSD